MSTEDAWSVRSFVALELEDRVRHELADLQQRLRPRVAGIRLVRPEGIHLTLRFLGWAPPDKTGRLRPALAAAAAACPPAEASIGGLGTFPERGSPRVLWLGIVVPQAVLELQRQCERAARAAGFGPEERPFRAHLTLGRWRDRAPHPELPAVDLGSTRVDTLVLYRSELRRDGAVYTPLERFSLGTAAD